MKRLTQIFQALLGVAALICTTLVAAGRLALRTIRDWWKKSSRWIRGLFVVALISIPAGFAALFAYAWYNNTYGRCHWRDYDLSKNLEVLGFRDGRYRVYNKSMSGYMTSKINWISGALEQDSLAVYALPHRRGYINVHTGEIVIDALENDYGKAWIFSDGLAAVVRNGKIGFINSRNEVVIPFCFDYSAKCRMTDFGYVFHNGYCAMTNADGDLGLIDTAGKWVIEPSYDEIWAPDESGCRIVVKDYKYGVLGSDCDIICPVGYDQVEILSDGIVLTDCGKKWQVDFDGNLIRDFIFDGTYYLNYPVGYLDDGEIEYAFADYLKYEVAGRYGIMDRITGKPVTPALYEDINMLSAELFEAQDPESYDWHLLDVNGNVVSGK